MIEIALTVIAAVFAYAYRNDMKYLREKVTEISIDSKERFEVVHKRIDDHEIRIRENEEIINKELK